MRADPTSGLLVACLFAASALGGCHEAPTASQIIVSPPFVRAVVLWRDSTATSIARGAFDDSSVYFLNNDLKNNHSVTADDKRTGRRRWQTQLTYTFDPGYVQGFSVTVAGGRVVVADIDAFGLDPLTGAIIWRYSPGIPGEVIGHEHTATVGSTVYFGGFAGSLYAIDATSGIPRWISHIFPDSAGNINDPLVVDGVIYVGFERLAFPRDIGGAAAVSAADGHVIWIRYAPVHPENPSGPAAGVAVSPTQVIFGSTAGPIYGLDRQTGVLIDSLPTEALLPAGGELGQKLYQWAQIGSHILVSSYDGTVSEIDGADLHVHWKTETKTGATLDMVADSAYVYVTGSGAAMKNFRLADGTFYWVVDEVAFRGATDPEVLYGAPLLDGTRLYAGGSHGIYAFQRP